MRVAIHTGQLLQPVPGGIGRYEIALLWRLHDYGVDATAFAAGPRPDGVAPHVPWIDIGWPRGGARYELWHRARRPIVRVPADVVHAPSLAIPPVSGRPLVVTAHDVAFLRIPHVTTKRGVRFHRRGLELARRHADLVVTPSQFTRLELVHEGFDPARLEVAPFGVSPAMPRDDADLDAAVERCGVRAPYVLTVGTIEPRKDLPTIVHAVESVRTTHPDLTLVIVGPRGWGEVRGLDRDFVRVLGEQPWPEVDALYRRASVFCAASIYEGFGLPAAESMVRGVPTVVTTGSSLVEVVGDAGACFDPGDVEACAAELRRVLDDDDWRADLADRGRARAAELTWELCAQRHAEVFARALTLAGS